MGHPEAHPTHLRLPNSGLPGPQLTKIHRRSCKRKLQVNCKPTANFTLTARIIFRHSNMPGSYYSPVPNCRGPPTPFFRKFATRKFRTTFLAELLHFRSIPKVIWEFGQYFDFGPSWGSKVMTKLNEKSLSYVFGPPKMAQIQKISQIPK